MSKILVKDVDFTYGYENNVEIGTGTVTASGKGHYIDSKSKDFQIVDIEDYGLRFTALEDGSTISLNNVLGNYKVSSDGNEWTPYTLGTTITLANSGECVFFSAVDHNDNCYDETKGSDEPRFSMSGRIEASGNIQYLLFSEGDEAEGGDSVPENCFTTLFIGCSSLEKAPSLPATNIAIGCYSGMFRDCTSLKQPPALPATTIYDSCYSGMFRGCSSLEQAPSLPATTLKDSCYSSMFRGCESLTQAPELTATSLAVDCYYRMFRGCTSLEQAPALPATTLKEGCYADMFRDCTALKQSPTLQATTIYESCYSGMFQGCISLLQAPALPATNIYAGCYSNMFSGCEKIRQAPALPATTLANSCYEFMFDGCTALEQAPALPATTLKPYCYQYMFNGCSSLVKAPALQATVLLSDCYMAMFYGCSSLNYLKTNQLSFDNCTDWLNGVSETGKFVCEKELVISERGSSTVPTGWNVIKNLLKFTASHTSGTSKITLNNVAGSYVTSRDGVSWPDYTLGTPITLSSNGDFVYIAAKDTNSTCWNGDENAKFTMSGSINASGNIQFLLKSDGSETAVPNNCFSSLFMDCTSLKTSPELTSESLGTYCYEKMFSGCTELGSAPALAAVTMNEGCYSYMFKNCKKITLSPVLAATTLADKCYEGMFYGCEKISEMPSLSVLDLKDGCYKHMFNGCKAITTAKNLSATTLKPNCYERMFANCSGLTSVMSTLPAPALVSSCYLGMFQGCSEITNAPTIQAVSLASDCCSYMFYGCTKLASAPTLSCTTLEDRCYLGMFTNCSTIEDAPQLDAVTLKTDCYKEMFYGCTKLDFVKTKQSSFDGCSNWLFGVAENGTFDCELYLDIPIDRSSSNVPASWNVVKPLTNQLYFENVGTDSITATLSNVEGTYKTSTNGVSWTNYTLGTPITVPVEGRIYFAARSSNATVCTESTDSGFSFSGNVAAHGSIMYLLNENGEGTLSGTQYCFNGLFSGCSTLTLAPELQAETLGFCCYYYMFYGCTSLTQAPELPATTLADGCYYSMFSDCTSLTQAPELQAETLATSCYSYMFQRCTSLTNAPELPATTLADGCYCGMFAGCTAITQAPELKATETVQNCYRIMFAGCSSLKYVKTNQTNFDGCTYWLYGVSATGDFWCNSDLTISKRGDSTVPTGWNVMKDVFCLTNTSSETVKVYLIDIPDSSFLITTNGVSWSVYHDREYITLNPNGGKVYMTAETENSKVGSSFYMLGSPNARVAASGNIQYLLDRTGENLTANEECFYHLFEDCSILESAPKLPATTLEVSCYEGMFSGCTALTQAPELPATTLAEECYYSMFYGCTSLTQAPELPATTLSDYCYSNMFQGCNSIEQAPSLPALDTQEGCYQYMFYGCTALTQAPELPSTLPYDKCYLYMFSGCTSLTQAPELPAEYMGANSYSYMFSDCTSLNYVKTNQVTFLGCGEWLSNVASTGTFESTNVSLDTSSITRGTSRIPVGWNLLKPDTLCFTAQESGTTVVRLSNVQGTYKTSKDGRNWSDYTIGSDIELTSVGDKVYFSAKTTNATVCDSSTSSGFYFSKTVAASGDIMYLLDENGPGATVTEYCFNSLFKDCSKLTQAPSLISFGLAKSCYQYMFYGCTALTQAPELPATTLVIGCYDSMFYGCTSLTQAPELPAITLANSCYKNMFAGCTAITQAPELPATTLSMNCYASMFDGCTSLTQATELLATTLTTACYSCMFCGCTSLTQAPELPATTLSDYCYLAMFKGCTSLTQAPELQATKLRRSCYEQMFYGCTSLTQAPELPATTLADICYSAMFLGCSSLNYVKTNQTSFDGCTDWLYNVASTGTFECTENLDTSSITRGGSTIPVNWEIVKPENGPLCFKAEQYESTVKLSNNLAKAYSFQYSTDGELWMDYTLGDTITLTNVDDKVYFKNSVLIDNLSSTTNGYRFTLSGRVAASGSIMYLLDPNGESTSVGAYCFYGLFQDCTSLTKAPALPATTLDVSCYYMMFYGCTSLTTPPTELKASDVSQSSYQYMFYGCSAMTSTPTIHATTVGSRGCYGMFYGCTSIVTAPELNATSLDSACYYSMFSGCTGLTTPPSRLPCVTLPAPYYVSKTYYGCYESMFEGCTSLTQAPELPATTLADYCYYSMFSGCTAITQAPALPATTVATYCYGYMFYGCTSLTQAPELPATTLADYCYYSMFSGCTSLTQAPSLPATTVATYCYGYMFYGCTSLTQAPELLTTTLTSNCYSYMFYGCSLLNYLKSYQNRFYYNNGRFTTYYCQAWLSGVAEYGLFKAPNISYNFERGASTVPSGWKVFTGQELSFTAVDAGSTVSLSHVSDDASFIVSTNNGDTWNDYTIGNPITLSNVGDKVYFSAKGTNTSVCEVNASEPAFIMTGRVSAAGNVQYLLSNSASTSTVPQYGFCMLFANCSSIVNSTLKLGASTVDACGYKEMFKGCTNITSPMEIYATSAATSAFQEMYSGCTGITSSVELSTASVGEYCCQGMYKNCTGLTTAANILTTTLNPHCFTEMFVGCDHLTSVPSLTATTLSDYCYSGMFKNCTALVNPPEITPTTTAAHCYSEMFKGCTALTSSPALTSTTYAKMSAYSCESMFEGCSALTNVPDFVDYSYGYREDYCFYKMFKDCTSLVTAPYVGWPTSSYYDIPNGVFSDMFSGCTSLVNAPEIKRSATSGSTSFARMFYNCSSLAYVKSSQDSFDGCEDWLYGVKNNGTFETTSSTIDTSVRGSSTVPTNWRVVSPSTLCFTAQENGSTITLNNVNGNYVYSTDGINWPDYTLGNTITLENSGDHVYLSAKTINSSVSDGSENPAFTMSGKISASGSIQCLLGSNTITAQYCFKKLFFGCTALTQAPELPATTLAKGCYSQMFQNCTSLTQAPALPATTLADYCYQYMFCNCKALTQAPELPATELATSCYYFMFWECTSLTQAPALPATTLAVDCYQNMFDGCTSLTQAPELPATTLASGCYHSMFRGCTSLTQAPELPATTLKPSCYVAMFEGCTSLTQAPELQATELVSYCYIRMFYGCKGINYIRTKQSSYTGCTNWLYGVATNGVFSCESSLDTTTRGASTVPTNWTVVDYNTLCFKALQDSSSVKLGYIDSGSYLQYLTSASGGNWANYTIGSNISLAKAGYCVLMKASNRNQSITANIDNSSTAFSMGGQIAATGNISYMMNKNGETSGFGYNYCMQKLFLNCTALKSMPNLNETDISKYCYQYMFKGCTSLVKPCDELPATTLYVDCYYAMFEGCTSLVKAPFLPAETLSTSEYSHMFYNCTNLKEIRTKQDKFYTNDGTSVFDKWPCKEWVYGIETVGDFYCKSTLVNEYGQSKIPSKWNRHDVY